MKRGKERRENEERTGNEKRRDSGRKRKHSLSVRSICSPGLLLKKMVSVCIGKVSLRDVRRIPKLLERALDVDIFGGGALSLTVFGTLS